MARPCRVSRPLRGVGGIGPAVQEVVGADQWHGAAAASMIAAVVAEVRRRIVPYGGHHEVAGYEEVVLLREQECFLASSTVAQV